MDVLTRARGTGDKGTEADGPEVAGEATWFALAIGKDVVTEVPV